MGLGGESRRGWWLACTVLPPYSLFNEFDSDLVRRVHSQSDECVSIQKPDLPASLPQAQPLIKAVPNNASAVV